VENKNPENEEVTLHLNYGKEGHTVTVKLGDLDDDQLAELYDSGLESARYVLRERTGKDPAVTFFNMTADDAEWKYDWLKRHGKLEEYVSGGDDRA
jgi:hypothetical protein